VRRVNGSGAMTVPGAGTDPDVVAVPDAETVADVVAVPDAETVAGAEAAPETVSDSVGGGMSPSTWGKEAPPGPEVTTRTADPELP
jgi:hypothetical protein